MREHRRYQEKKEEAQAAAALKNSLPGGGHENGTRQFQTGKLHHTRKLSAPAWDGVKGLGDEVRQNQGPTHDPQPYGARGGMLAQGYEDAQQDAKHQDGR